MSEKKGYNHGDFGWNELAVENPEAAVAFYAQTFGWKVEEMDTPGGKYHVLLNGEEKIGGITLRTEEQKGVVPMWMPYITVDDVDKTVEQIETSGGKIVMPPQDIPVPNGPRLAVLQDPFGTKLGAITYAAVGC